MTVDESAFERAVSSAAPLLDGPDAAYDAEMFVKYAAHIIEQMGGRGDGVDACAREVYREWAACQHFELYDDVPDVLRELAASGVRIGLISNSHRCLASFESHFELRGLIAAAVSSSDHGFLKPHPSIFQTALQMVNVPAADAVMVGDNVRQDIEGALAVGMRAVLLHRDEAPHAREAELMPPPACPSSARCGPFPPLIAPTRQFPPEFSAHRIPITQLHFASTADFASRAPGGQRAFDPAPAEQVQMDVEDRLAGVAICVEHGAKAARVQAPLLRNGCRSPHHLAHNSVVSRLKVVQRVDVPLGDDEHVRRCLRVDVVEGEQTIVFVHDGAGNLASDDLAEQAIRHTETITPQRRLRKPTYTRSMIATLGMPCRSGLTSVILRPGAREINSSTARA